MTNTNHAYLLFILLLLCVSCGEVAISKVEQRKLNIVGEWKITGTLSVYQGEELLEESILYPYSASFKADGTCRYHSIGLNGEPTYTDYTWFYQFEPEMVILKSVKVENSPIITTFPPKKIWIISNKKNTQEWEERSLLPDSTPGDRQVATLTLQRK